MVFHLLNDVNTGEVEDQLKKPHLSLNTEFLPDRHGYKVYCKDRVRGGGGVLILVREFLNSIAVPELDTDCETLWVKLKIKGRRSLYTCSYYRPDVRDKTSILKWQTSVERAANISNAFILIGGDLNLPGWDWSMMTLKPNTHNLEMHLKLIEVIQENGMEQMVTFPTREQNTFDLITNTPQLISRVEAIPRISDHEIVYMRNLTSRRRRENK